MVSLSKGWTMIFKAVKGVTVPLVGDLWNSSSSQSENTMAALDTTTTHHAHYKNRIVQEWETFNPAQVINWKETDCLKRQQQQQQKHDQYKNKQTNKKFLYKPQVRTSSSGSIKDSNTTALPVQIRSIMKLVLFQFIWRSRPGLRGVELSLPPSPPTVV